MEFNFWVLLSFHLETIQEAMAHAQQSDNPFKQENVTRVRNSVFVGQGTWDLNIGVELKLGHQPVR